ncbi:hypothetical protein BDA99DRAFT_497084 [Phascolomyces articulosus]|uniref:Secreted protein n=1 Tax=Phascolomyces articulosus TaxID=60185 RepID=A0AAD5KK84_9FUNG|nr:hypothetical protein BDA99DRAFT_497084 [Phascolomyces articulosus]
MVKTLCLLLTLYFPHTQLTQLSLYFFHSPKKPASQKNTTLYSFLLFFSKKYLKKRLDDYYFIQPNGKKKPWMHNLEP